MAASVSGRVQVLREVSIAKPNGWVLCLQWCRYVYSDGRLEAGYRFIWRRPGNGHLQGARGQARIPSLAEARRLMDMAREEGWAELEGDGTGSEAE